MTGIGIMGAGMIAAKMAETLGKMEGVRFRAVAARDLDRAREFARVHGAEKAYGSYREMLEDPEVRLVYVATVNSSHYEHMRLCLEHGKHILCEKPFTVTAARAREIFALAKEKGLLVTEALWTRYLPFMRTIGDFVRDGGLGRVHTLSANLGNDVKGWDRLAKPELGGGALLDLGVYTLTFAAMTMGTDIERVEGSCRMLPTGVDGQECLTLHYRSGAMAVLLSSAMTATDRRGIFYGEKGYMVVENLNNPSSYAVYSPEHRLVSSAERPAQINGFEYQVTSALNAIARGDTECPELPHAETLRILDLTDRLRKEWGVAGMDG